MCILKNRLIRSLLNKSINLAILFVLFYVFFFWQISRVFRIIPTTWLSKYRYFVIIKNFDVGSLTATKIMNVITEIDKDNPIVRLHLFTFLLPSSCQVIGCAKYQTYSKPDNKEVRWKTCIHVIRYILLLNIHIILMLRHDCIGWTIYEK